MKKKIIFTFIAVACMAAQAFAYDFSYTYQGQTLYYNIVNGKAQVTYQTYGGTYSPWYTNLTGALTIPDSVTHNGNTYMVTSIDNYTFWKCSDLTSVSIPNSVTSIGNDTFHDCTSLTSVTIPNSVTSIGGSTFSGCSGLTSITIPNSVTSIGSQAFANCTSITSITIPNSVTSIGFSAFLGCSGLTSITISTNITSIQGDTFNGCSGLTSVTIPNSVASIGNNAFLGCSGLISVTIPNSVTSIGRGAFKDCSGLTSVTIPNSVTSISNNTFHNCSGLTSVTIPNSVTSIGSGAFCGCRSLTSITIPNSVTSIGGNYTFSDCFNLTSVTIPNSVTSIGNYAFSQMKHIEYYGSATGAPWGALSMNGVIDGDFVFPNSVKDTLLAYIGSGGAVTIPSTVTLVGGYAFYYCRGLTSVTIPNSVTSIGSGAFENCSGLDSVIIPNSVTSIGSYAFYGCSGLTSVTISNNITSIGDYTFTDCTSLTSVTIPNSVTSIGGSTFSGCSGLTSITIPNSVTSIGQWAFYGCGGLTSVNYTGTIAQWCDIDFYSSIFSNPTYYSHTLSINGSPLTNLVIPEGVAEIKQSAFYNCSGLTSVTIPNSVTSIGISAFSGCSGLTSVTIPNSVTSISNNAFYRVKHIEYYGSASGAPWGAIAMNGVTDGDFVFSNSVKDTLLVYLGSGGAVTIPSTVTLVGGNAFFNCSSLTSVTIPNSVTSIGSGAFENCSGLTEIHSLSQVAPTLGENAFKGVSSTIPVHIPCGSLLSYFEHWSHFSNIMGEVAYTFSAESADDNMGVVQILTMPTCADSNAVIKAVPNNGYRFDHWSTGSTNNPYTLTVTTDTVITAYFISEGGTEGIDDMNASGFRVYSVDGRIVVDGAEGETLHVYDMMGREVFRADDADKTSVLPLGVYLVKIGTLPARKVVVIR